MTMAVPGDTSAVFDPEMYGDVGLEDIDSSDVVIPRLRIVHAEGLFENNLSKEKYPQITAVILGLVKQRIMWDSKVEAGDVPQCKSPDFAHGFPNLSNELRKETRFPWDRSNFSPSDAAPLEIAPKTDKAFLDGWSSNGHAVLPCASCSFAQWGKDGAPPACAEQHTYPLLYSPDPDADIEDFTPALLTVQKTAIKPSRRYINSFAQTKTHMFTVFTRLGLDLQTRGSVKYSVPSFQRLGQTDPEHWVSFAERARTIRSFVRQAPRPTESDGDADFAPTVEARTVTTAPASAAPTVVVAAPEPTTSDDDLPF